MSEREEIKQKDGDEVRVTEEEVDEYINPFKNIYQEALFVLALTCGQLFTQCGVAMANQPLQLIGDHFGDTSTAFRSWYVAAYSLTVGTFILIAGQLGDMYGHKKLLIIGFGWFALWSLLAGVSNYVSTSIFFIICRALQGIGAATVMPTCMAIIGRTYADGPRRHMVFAIFGAAAPIGYVVGAIFASVLAQFAGWPWSFYAMAIACSTMLPIAIYSIPNDPHHVNTERFDYWGAFTGVAALVLFNVAWNQAPIVGWQEPYTYVLLIISILFFIAFYFCEQKWTTNPLIPPCNGTTMLVLTIVACGWMALGIMIFNLLQFMEVLRGDTPLQASVHMIPCAVMGATAAIATGFLMSRVPTSILMLFTLIIWTIVTCLCATLPVDQSYWKQSFVIFLIMCLAMELSFPAATIMLSAQVPKRQQGVAASLVATVVNYSISIGLGFSGTAQEYTYPGDDFDSLLSANRVAFYVAIGLSVGGLLLSVLAVYKELFIDKRKQPKNSPASIQSFA